VRDFRQSVAGTPGIDRYKTGGEGIMKTLALAALALAAGTVFAPTQAQAKAQPAETISATLSPLVDPTGIQTDVRISFTDTNLPGGKADTYRLDIQSGFIDVFLSYIGAGLTDSYYRIPPQSADLGTFRPGPGPVRTVTAVDVPALTAPYATVYLGNLDPPYYISGGVRTVTASITGTLTNTTTGLSIPVTEQQNFQYWLP
jgi:hypothetical protein